MNVSLLKQNKSKHLCDECLFGFTTCSSPNIKFGIDFDSSLRGREADAVRECGIFCYKKK